MGGIIVIRGEQTISRAYEANQKMITSIDQQMQKALEALG